MSTFSAAGRSDLFVHPLLQDFYDDMHRLTSWARDAGDRYFQGRSCYRLRLSDRVTFHGSSAFVVATLVQQGITRADGDVERAALHHDTCLLRVDAHKYQAVLQHCTEVRILQARVQEGTPPVICADMPGATFAATARVRADTVVQMAELFAGGFSGWSEAAWALWTQGQPLRTAWLLDHDTNWLRAATVRDRQTQVATNPGELQTACQPDHADARIYVVADIKDSWWHKLFGCHAGALPEPGRV